MSLVEREMHNQDYPGIKNFQDVNRFILEQRACEKQSPFNTMTFTVDHWSFVIVGMRFSQENFGGDPITATMVEDCKYLAVFKQPDNKHDPNALLVKGVMSDGKFHPVGFISKTSHPKTDSGIPDVGTDGLVFKVYDSWSSGPDAAAVHVRLDVKSAVPVQNFVQE